jgi:hypothetical protein
LFSLADRLWTRAARDAHIEHRIPAALSLTIEVHSTPDAHRLAPVEERWIVEPTQVEVSVGSELHARIDRPAGRMVARVSDRFVTDRPSFVARLLLETAVAVMLTHRAYAVLHAGAVVGPAGAVVVRGAAGAGKSTLIAAAYRGGFGTLGDETILAARDDPDDLLAAVREVTLVPDAARLLGLSHVLAPVRAGPNRELKERLDLLDESSPGRRHARRAATIVLGPRNAPVARLEPLSPDEFLRAFGQGDIVQERWSGTPPAIAAAWAERDVYRLSGTRDLTGALALLRNLVALPAARHA